MNKFLSLLILLFLILGLTACLDEIDFDVPAGQSDGIVINGRLTKGDPSTAEVIVSRVFDFDASSRSLVSVRDVMITGEDGMSITLQEMGVGIYKAEIDSRSDFIVDHNRSYKLSLRTVTGIMYESEMELLVPVPSIDTLIVSAKTVDIVNILGDFDKGQILTFEVQTPTIVEGFEPAIMWEILRTYKVTDLDDQVCYITENAVTADLRLFIPDDVNVDAIEQYEILDAPFDSRIAEGSLFEITQVSLNDRAREYWSNALTVSRRTGGMFEPQAGLIKGNIKNLDDPEIDVFGYFLATEANVYYVKVERDQFPDILINPICPPPIVQCPGDICCDCLEVNNSTEVQPERWNG